MRVTAVGQVIRNALYFVTNYGLVSYVFAADLTNLTDITTKENPFKPLKIRIIDLPLDE